MSHVEHIHQYIPIFGIKIHQTDVFPPAEMYPLPFTFLFSLLPGVSLTRTSRVSLAIPRCSLINRMCYPSSIFWICPESIPAGHTLNTSTGRRPGGILIRCPNCLNCPLSVRKIIGNKRFRLSSLLAILFIIFTSISRSSCPVWWHQDYISAFCR